MSFFVSSISIFNELFSSFFLRPNKNTFKMNSHISFIIKVNIWIFKRTHWTNTHFLNFPSDSAIFNLFFFSYSVAYKIQNIARMSFSFKNIIQNGGSMGLVTAKKNHIVCGSYLHWNVKIISSFFPKTYFIPSTQHTNHFENSILMI